MDLTPLPQAWMGYALPLRNASRACVRICAWCPDKSAAEAIAAKADHDVTHGACTVCSQRMMSEVLGETAA